MTSFKEFLQKKVEGTDWKERNARRTEWLGALDRLFARIRDLLKESDPDGILEIVKYEVERVEGLLGVYDAPALRIDLGTQSVKIVPVGRNVPKPISLMNLLAIPGNATRWGDLSAGRVDFTDDDRKHILLRSLGNGQEHWHVLMAQKPQIPIEFNDQSLEAILQDLLS